MPVLDGSDSKSNTKLDLLIGHWTAGVLAGSFGRVVIIGVAA